jgi:hypothetical protein
VTAVTSEDDLAERVFEVLHTLKATIAGFNPLPGALAMYISSSAPRFLLGRRA